MVILDNSKNLSPSGLPRGFKTKVVALLSQSWAGLKFYFLVKGMQSRTARRAALGKRVVFSKRARVLGWKCVRIGSNTIVSDDTWILANHPDSSVKIGESCFVGLRNFFTASERIELGDFCMTAPGCSFLGASHRRSDPLTPYLAAAVKKEGSIVIGTNCSIGAGVLILANSVVGHGSVLGAGAVVKGVFPPFSLLVGNPARVARRFDFSSQLWVAPGDPSIDEGHPFYCEEAYRDEIRRSWAGFRAFPSMATIEFGSF